MRGPALTHSGPDGFRSRTVAHHSLRLRNRTSTYLTNNYYSTDTWTTSRGLDNGVSRGRERLVVGSDGSAWYTDNHYRTFRQI